MFFMFMALLIYFRLCCDRFVTLKSFKVLIEVLSEKNNFFGSVYAELQLLENLTFRSTLGIDFSDFKRKNIEPKVNNGFITRGTNRLIYDTNKLSSLVFSNVLNYNLEFGESKFGVILGVESVNENFDTLFLQQKKIRASF